MDPLTGRPVEGLAPGAAPADGTEEPEVGHGTVPFPDPGEEPEQGQAAFPFLGGPNGQIGGAPQPPFPGHPRMATAGRTAPVGPGNGRVSNSRKEDRTLGREHLWSLFFALGFFALVVARLGELTPLSARIRPVLLLLLGGVIFFYRGRKRLGIDKLLKDRILLFTGLYLGWAVFIIPFAVWRGRAFDILNIIPIVLALVLSISSVPPFKKNLELFFKGMVILAAMTGLGTLMTGTMEVGRLSTGGMLDSNDLASLLAATMPFGLAIGLGIEKGKNHQKLLAWGAVFLMAMILLQTGSRGGMVAMVAGLFIMFLRMNAKRVIVFGVVASVLAPVIWSQTPPDVQERFTGMGSLSGDYNVTEEYGRVETWKRGVGYIVSNPIFGLGYGNFTVAEGNRLRAMGRFGGNPYYSAHNAYIQAFAELGLIGGFFLLALIANAAKRAMRLWKMGHPEYLASLGAFCAGAVFLSHAYSYTLFGIVGTIAFASRTLDPTGIQAGSRKKRSRRGGIQMGRHGQVAATR